MSNYRMLCNSFTLPADAIPKDIVNHYEMLAGFLHTMLLCLFALFGTPEATLGTTLGPLDTF